MSFSGLTNCTLNVTIEKGIVKKIAFKLKSAFFIVTALKTTNLTEH
jgi:hypothetical protein